MQRRRRVKKGNGGSRRRRRIKRTYFIRNTHGSGGHLEAGLRNLDVIFKPPILIHGPAPRNANIPGGGIGRV